MKAGPSAKFIYPQSRAFVQIEVISRKDNDFLGQTHHLGTIVARQKRKKNLFDERRQKPLAYSAG